MRPTLMGVREMVRNLRRVLTYLDGGETQQRGGFHIVDNIDELLNRWTTVVLAREI